MQPINMVKKSMYKLYLPYPAELSQTPIFIFFFCCLMHLIHEFLLYVLVFKKIYELFLFILLPNNTSFKSDISFQLTVRTFI